MNVPQESTGRAAVRRGEKSEMRARRIITFMVSLIISGCRVLESEETSVPSPAPPATEALASTPTAAPIQASPTPSAPAEIVLVVWTVEQVAAQSEAPGGQELLEQLAAFDEIHPDIQVEFYVKRQSGPGSTLEYLRSAPPVAPGILPDIALMDRNSLIQAAQESLVVPIGSLLDQDQLALYPVAAELGSVGDALIGLPYVMDTQHIVYRQAFFQEEPPVSYEDILGGPTVYAFPAGSTSGVNMTTLTQYLAAGGDLVDAEGAPHLDTAALASVLAFYDQGRAEDKILAEVFQLSDAEDTWALYRSGQVGIADITASLYLAEHELVRSTGLSWIPTQDGEPFALVSGWSWVIVTQDPERQEAALALINYLMEPVNQGDYTLAVHYLPSQPAALAVWGDDPYAAFAEVLLENAVPLPGDASLRPIGDLLQDSVEAVLLNDTPPVQAATQAFQMVTPSPSEP
jgi:ABC-type glycerol-3-phosphate transport system substrate-binding protein